MVFPHHDSIPQPPMSHRTPTANIHSIEDDVDELNVEESPRLAAISSGGTSTPRCSLRSLRESTGSSSRRSSKKGKTVHYNTSSSVESFEGNDIADLSDISHSTEGNKLLLSSSSSARRAILETLEDDHVEIGEEVDGCDSQDEDFVHQPTDSSSYIAEEIEGDEDDDDDIALPHSEEGEDSGMYDSYDEGDAHALQSHCAVDATPSADALPQPHEAVEVSAIIQDIELQLRSTLEHPYLCMREQEQMIQSERSQRHYEYCVEETRNQHVSVYDRTAMIRCLLNEAHRHHTTKLSRSGVLRSVHHLQGWKHVAADIDRTLTMEGALSAQRKLSCMCIFNPATVECPLTDGGDDERMRRLERQEHILQMIYHQRVLGGNHYFLDENSYYSSNNRQHQQQHNISDGFHDDDDDSRRYFHDEDEEDEEEDDRTYRGDAMYQFGNTYSSSANEDHREALYNPYTSVMKRVNADSLFPLQA